MIRATTPADTDALVRLAAETGSFKPIEIEALCEVLDDYFSANCAIGHRCITWEDRGSALGFAYFAPAAMTDRTWYLYWIVVSKSQQGRGLGRSLLRDVENEVCRQGGRHLLIETGSTPAYEPTRRFYVKHGYTPVAVIPDYYAEGDSMVVFRKAFV